MYVCMYCNFCFQVLIVGNQRYSCVKSRYNDGIATVSNKMRDGQRLFSTGVDKNKVSAIKEEIKRCGVEINKLEETIKQAIADEVMANRRQEELKKEVNSDAKQTQNGII